MRKLFLILIFFLVVGAFVSVKAQQEVVFSTVETDLWPEYDQPAVLVIYRITLGGDVSLPADITLRIPARAGKPNAVAVRQADGQLLNLVYEQQAQGEWSTLSFQATMPELQIEFYDPALEKNGAERHFEYQWPGDHAVQAMTVQVQEPLGASQMRLSPNMGSGVAGSDGMTYYTAEVGSLNAGQTFAVSMDYSKSNDELSASNLQVQPSAPLDETTSGRATNIGSLLPWILGGLGLVLIVGGGVWYWKSGLSRDNAGKSGRKRARRSAAAAQPAASSEGATVYCTNCGKRASASDRFCRTCGTPLRN
jgi:hypothetical protein